VLRADDAGLLRRGFFFGFAVVPAPVAFFTVFFFVVFVAAAAGAGAGTGACGAEAGAEVDIFCQLFNHLIQSTMKRGLGIISKKLGV
jgi:hypothetical protein